MSSVSQYLLAIYIAQHRHEPSGTIAETLGRSPAAVTEMCSRLAGNGFVSDEPSEGVHRTESEYERADRRHETNVTISRFSRDMSERHDHEAEAIELAGVASPTVTERLAATRDETHLREHVRRLRS